MHNLSIDKANSKSTNFYQRFKSYLYLKYHNVKFGSNTFVKKNFEIKKSKNSSIQIGDDCIIQENVFFLLTMPNPKLTIGNNGSVVGANSVVNKNIPEYQIWAGNPAKFIRAR